MSLLSAGFVDNLKMQAIGEVTMDKTISSNDKVATKKNIPSKGKVPVNSTILSKGQTIPSKGKVTINPKKANVSVTPTTSNKAIAVDRTTWNKANVAVLNNTLPIKGKVVANKTIQIKGKVTVNEAIPIKSNAMIDQTTFTQDKVAIKKESRIPRMSRQSRIHPVTSKPTPAMTNIVNGNNFTKKQPTNVPPTTKPVNTSVQTGVATSIKDHNIPVVAAPTDSSTLPIKDSIGIPANPFQPVRIPQDSSSNVFVTSPMVALPLNSIVASIDRTTALDVDATISSVSSQPLNSPQVDTTMSPLNSPDVGTTMSSISPLNSPKVEMPIDDPVVEHLPVTSQSNNPMVPDQPSIDNDQGQNDDELPGLDLEKLRVIELRQLCKDQGIVTTRKNKRELVMALTQHSP